MRSPSEKLSELLIRSHLCAPHELSSSERRVRRLCRDLPDFDSVWLDALVQQRVLTPWQAEVVQSASPERLTVGDFVLRQPLGRACILGHDTDRINGYVFRRLEVRSLAAESDESPVDQMQQHLETLKQATTRCPGSLCLPLRIVGIADNDGLRKAETLIGGSGSCVVSPFVPGWPLDELLNRGGRFPWQAVAEIGRELLVALAWLDSLRLLHGDVVLRNVRLTPGGKTVLVDPFVRRLLQPRLMLTETLTLRDCDGISPEQVGTGRTADSRSELYALGCLLWQLLSCRPIVLTADPVSRLMKLKEQDIADVRTTVPDCPEWMARLILSMTRRSPELRPSGAEEVLAQWRRQSGGGCREVRRIVHRMPERRLNPLPPRRRPATSGSFGKIRPLLLTTVSLVALAILGSQTGVLPRTLRVGPPSSWITQLQQPAPERPTGLLNNEELAERVLNAGFSGSGSLSANESHPDTASSRLAPVDSQATEPDSPGIRNLPAPDAQGVVTLRYGATYLAQPLTHPRQLRIVTVGGRTEIGTTTAPGGLQPAEFGPQASHTAQPTVLVPHSDAWQLRAPTVHLRNLTIRHIEPQSAASPTADSANPQNTQTANSSAIRSQSMLLVVSDRLVLDHCRLINDAEFGSGACCQWSVGEPSVESSPAVGSSVYQQDARARIPEPPQTVLQLSNSVLTGGGYGLRLAQPPQEITLSNSLFATQGSAIRCDFNREVERRLMLNIDRLTCRVGPAFIDVVVRESAVPEIEVLVRGGESVIDPQQALLRVAAPENWGMHRFRATFALPSAGNPTIVPPATEIGLYYDRQLRSLVRIPDDRLSQDSLLIAEPLFADSDIGTEGSDAGRSIASGRSGNVNDHRLIDYEGPKLNSRMPGIDASLLPAR